MKQPKKPSAPPEPKSQLTLRIPKALHKQLKQRALDNETSVNDLSEIGLRMVLAK